MAMSDEVRKEFLGTVRAFKEHVKMEQSFGRDRVHWEDSRPPLADLDLPSEKLRARALDEEEVVASKCTKCGLHRGRTQVVFGVGNTDADLMFIGEGPGREEDRQGIPFVGTAGQLLT